MKKTNSKFVVSLTALCILVFSTNRAYAYLDPGTGSMLIQGLLAAIAAASVSIGIFWRRLRSFFGHKNSEKNGRDDG
jgi:hypothetical protein